MPMAGIGSYAKQLILQGLSNAEILRRIRERFPDCNTTPGCIAWYRNDLKRNGANLPTAMPRGETGTSWPEWNLPGNPELLWLAKLTTPYIRFLHPEIVQALVEDNERKTAAWRAPLADRGIPWSVYLWERSACAFPGVRRYSGSAEIAQFNGKSAAAPAPKDALDLDDNSYPKQVWSFVLRGGKFANNGPTGYSLAHIADHKKYKDRGPDEFDGVTAVAPWETLHGLFTCVTNTVFIAEALIRPTDFAFPLRNLIQRKAVELYGGFCNLLPPHLSVRSNPAPEWVLEEFEWCPAVKPTLPVANFLAFREQKMAELLARPASR